MYIISKYKDYYDSVAVTSGLVDKSIIYNRQEIELESKDIPKIVSNKFNLCVNFYSSEKDKESHLPLYELCNYSRIKNNTSKYIDSRLFIIGFCGKLYIGWKLYYKTYENYIEVTHYDITYDLNCVKNLRSSSYSYYEKKHSINDSYNKIKNADVLEIFRFFKTPIFVFEAENGGKFFVNPILKEYEFYKIFNTYQTFQEISMFIGGVLGSNEKNVIEIDDRTKIKKHGFDLKWSFRKESKNNK